MKERYDIIGYDLSTLLDTGAKNAKFRAGKGRVLTKLAVMPQTLYMSRVPAIIYHMGDILVAQKYKKEFTRPQEVSHLKFLH